MTAAWKAGAMAAALVAVAVLAVWNPWHPVELALELFVGAVPALLLTLWFSERTAEARLEEVVARLGTGGPVHTVRDALRRALSDPTLEIVYARVGTGGWIDELGEQAPDPVRVAGRTFTSIARQGKPVAGLVHDPALLRHPQRLRTATNAASLAIDNERLKAELRAELLDVQASRARIVEAGERELQRVERNLHDGAQQRLVGLALMLSLAARSAAGDPTVAGLLADAVEELGDAIAELRELTRGIHPAIVADAGLARALGALAERPGVPLALHLDLPDRLPEPIEVGAYYVVSEAVANTNKHAHAQQASVQAAIVDGVLRVSVRDDGAGGAAATAGSGLEGLGDRVSGLGGTFVIDSPPGGGTTVVAELPLSFQVLSDVERRRTSALRWVGWENWAAPAELYDQLTHEDNLLDSRLVLLCAGGNHLLTDRERDWFVGYLTAAGDADWVIDAIAAYDDSETLDELMQLPGASMIARGVPYQALRLCASDGPLTHAELDRLRRGSDAIGVPRATFDELHRIVAAEQELRDQRYELIVAPVLPHASR